MNLFEKWRDVSGGYLKQNYILFTTPWNKILHFSLLRLEYFFSVFHTVAICALCFGCFVDIFFCNCLGFPTHSSHSLNGWMREETTLYQERYYQVLSEIWTVRINGTIKHLKANFYDATLLRETILCHVTAKWYFIVGEKLKNSVWISGNKLVCGHFPETNQHL